jgi:hypothetical protein
MARAVIYIVKPATINCNEFQIPLSRSNVYRIIMIVYRIDFHLGCRWYKFVSATKENHPDSYRDQ